MSFDFHSFRQLLYQNAIEDAINYLAKHKADGYAGLAERIRNQYTGWRGSSRWNPFARRRKSRYHETIIRNLYAAGLAASRNEAPPEIQSIHPVRQLLLGYAGAFILLAGSFFLLTWHPECPTFEKDKQIPIIIDKFVSYHEPLLQAIGLNNRTFENHIKGKLSLNNVSAAIHPVSVYTRDEAREQCRKCGARMLIFGSVDYRGEGKALLDYYLDHESYESYILKHGIPEAEEAYKGIFDLKTQRWIGEVTCLVNLFEGLIAKEKYQMATSREEKQDAIRLADKLFDKLSRCTIDDTLKLFALHCLAWAKVQQNDDTSALRMYNRILEIDTNNALALNNSALLYKKQDNYLYANIRYEKILEKNDIPYIRLAKADALIKLNRKEEARREVRQVKESTDYQLKKEAYDRRIQRLPTAHIEQTGSVNELAPSAYLSTLATKFNSGDKQGSIRGLDSLSATVDMSTLSQEDILVMRELYKQAGAADKATEVSTRAALVGKKVPSQSSAILKALRRD